MVPREADCGGPASVLRPASPRPHWRTPTALCPHRAKHTQPPSHPSCATSQVRPEGTGPPPNRRSQLTAQELVRAVHAVGEGVTLLLDEDALAAGTPELVGQADGCEEGAVLREAGGNQSLALRPGHPPRLGSRRRALHQNLSAPGLSQGCATPTEGLAGKSPRHHLHPQEAPASIYAGSGRTSKATSPARGPLGGGSQRDHRRSLTPRGVGRVRGPHSTGQQHSRKTERPAATLAPGPWRRRPQPPSPSPNAGLEGPRHPREGGFWALRPPQRTPCAPQRPCARSPTLGTIDEGCRAARGWTPCWEQVGEAWQAQSRARGGRTGRGLPPPRRASAAPQGSRAGTRHLWRMTVHTHAGTPGPIAKSRLSRFSTRVATQTQTCGQDWCPQRWAGLWTGHVPQGTKP